MIDLPFQTPNSKKLPFFFVFGIKYSKNFSDDIKTESVSPENVRSESINKKENYDYY